MKPFCLLSLSLISSCLLATSGYSQNRPSRGGTPDKSLLQRFDTNGDGVLDEQERRAVRSKIQQMQNKPGAMTPSAQPQIIGNRTITDMQFASSDGKLIPCVLSMPQGPGPFPMLVTIHGGQGNRDYNYIRSMAAPTIFLRRFRLSMSNPGRSLPSVTELAMAHCSGWNRTTSSLASDLPKRYPRWIRPVLASLEEVTGGI